VDTTAEATAAGALYSDAAGKLVCSRRPRANAMIGFVVLCVRRLLGESRAGETITNKAKFVWQKFPKFSSRLPADFDLATLPLLHKYQITALANLSRWAFLLTFAGVGLRTNSAK